MNLDIDKTTVKRLMFDETYQDVLYIELNDRQSPPITCHTNESWEYTLDTSTEVGKKMYAALLAAYMGGRELGFDGRGDCVVAAGRTTETLRRIELK